MHNNQCFLCKYYFGIINCAAFQAEEIPNEIICGDFVHNKKHPDQDSDILFEPKDEE